MFFMWKTNWSSLEEYKERVQKGEDPKKVMDSLGLERYCCRSTLLGHVDLIDTAAKFKK
jgi:DNA-directed RNA polymerase subunit N